MRFLVPIKHRIVALISIMATMSICIIVFIILPTIKKITTLEQKIFETEKFLEVQYQRAKQLRQSIVRLDDLTATAAIYDRAVISEGEELRLITEFEALAEKEGVQQSFTIAYHEAEKNPKSPKLPFVIFSFTNQGGFGSHMRYIEALEKLPYYVFIDRMTWEKKQLPRQETDETLALRFDAKIYIKKKP